MLSGMRQGRQSDMVISDDVAWDHVDTAAPISPSPTGGGGVPAPNVEAPVTAAPAVEPEESDDDLLAPVVTTADDGTEDERDPVLNHPRVKALRKENRKLLRRFQKFQPIASRVQGRNLDEIIHQAESYQQLTRAAQANPRLAALLTGEPAAPRREPAPASQFDDLTPEQVPFDTDSDVGRYMLAEFNRSRQAVRALQQQLAGTANEFGTFRQAIGQRAEVAARTNWKTAVEASAKELPEGVREMFMDAIHGAYTTAKARNLPITPQQAIDHYLSKYKAAKQVTQQQQDRASNAASQRMAEHNRTLPRQTTAAGVPAPVRTGGERVSDVNRRIRRFGF